MPIFGDMGQRLLTGIIVVLLGLIVASRLRQSAPALPAAPPPVQRPATTSATERTTRAPMMAPLPNALAAPTTGTPTIDLMAILAVRRRIAREGAAVYLDSMLARSDSTVARWVDRGDTPLRVAFPPDSLRTSVPPASLDAVRAGMAAWNGNAAGVRFVEVSDVDAADIVVLFVATVSATGEFGVTHLTWLPSGAAQHAEIQLALRPDSTAPMLAPAMLRRVAIHEFGHAIGLPHSGSRDDIMHPSSPVSAPSRRDLATLQLLYALPPGSIRTP